MLVAVCAMQVMLPLKVDDGALTLTEVALMVSLPVAVMVMSPDASNLMVEPFLFFSVTVGPDSSNSSMQPCDVLRVIFTEPWVSSNSSTLLLRVLMTRLLFASSMLWGSFSLPFQHAPSTYGRRRSPAS